MKFKMYCIYDAVTKNYHIPFYMRSHAEAVRSYENALNDSESPASKNPQDYSMFYVGEYDDDNGQVTSISPERIR